MMQPCHYCSNWAQWRCRKPIFNAEEKLVGFELIALLCGLHKVEQENIVDNALLRFDFVGAAPMVNC